MVWLPLIHFAFLLQNHLLGLKGNLAAGQGSSLSFVKLMTSLIKILSGTYENLLIQQFLSCYCCSVRSLFNYLNLFMFIRATVVPYIFF